VSIYLGDQLPCRIEVGSQLNEPGPSRRSARHSSVCYPPRAAESHPVRSAYPDRRASARAIGQNSKPASSALYSSLRFPIRWLTCGGCTCDLVRTEGVSALEPTRRQSVGKQIALQSYHVEHAATCDPHTSPHSRTSPVRRLKAWWSGSQRKTYYDFAAASGDSPEVFTRPRAGIQSGCEDEHRLSRSRYARSSPSGPAGRARVPSEPIRGGINQVTR
jgi:hypothetical protein